MHTAHETDFRRQNDRNTPALDRDLSERRLGGLESVHEALAEGLETFAAIDGGAGPSRVIAGKGCGGVETVHATLGDGVDPRGNNPGPSDNRDGATVVVAPLAVDDFDAFGTLEKKSTGRP